MPAAKSSDAPPTGDGKSAPPEIILDLSRLLSRVLHATPTGVDRVEMAYARELLRTVPDRLSFAAVHPVGIYGRLATDAVVTFLDEVERQWAGTASTSTIEQRITAARRLFALRPGLPPKPVNGRPRVFVQASPHHLDKPKLVERILKREQARFVCLVHDLIPIEYPEYARPGGAALHRKRMDTLGTYADALIANSQATADALAAYLQPGGRIPPIEVAHLGTDSYAIAPELPDNGEIPYFVCVGTIEPRKNHILLLKLWRRMAERHGDRQTIPKLVLIGRRGWENENVIDMLDRCPQLKPHVIEANGMPDGHARDLIRGARALLLPSFAEGYGMPVAEALDMHVPVICSDIPALREVGGAVPEYLDPLDGPAWMAAIKDYALGASTMARAQRLRMNLWRRTEWSEHLQLVLETINRMISAKH